jgi:hypothetical protein
MGIARIRSFIDLYFILSRVSDQLDWEAFREHRSAGSADLGCMLVVFGLFGCRTNFQRWHDGRARAGESGRSRNALPGLMEAVPGAARNKIWHLICTNTPGSSVSVMGRGLPFRMPCTIPKVYSDKRRMSWMGLRGERSVEPGDPAQVHRSTK